MSCILLIFVLLVGCGNDNFDRSADRIPLIDLTQPFDDPSTLTILEGYVRTLTSDEFGGRMAGTRGNDLTIEWLSERLITLGVEPYSEDGYKIAFPGWSNTFIRSDMIVTGLDNSVRVLEQGTDFFISLGEGNFSLEIDNSANYTVLTPGNNQESEPDDSSEEASEEASNETHDEASDETHDETADKSDYFVYNGSFRNTAGSFSQSSADEEKTIQLSEELYAIVNGGYFRHINITNEVSYKETELYHVVGKISGKDPSNCVVISAHFDGVGRGGSTFFPGAFDNASGTAALLYITERLMSASRVRPFDFDIVIAFFNSEEHIDNGPLGSKHFVPIVREDYSNLWNINIDSVGSSEGETYNTGDSGSSALRESFTAFADEFGIKLDNDTPGFSDNVNFTALRIPSFSFMSADYITNGLAHTNMDTYDRLHYPQIARLSEMIVEFLSQDGISIFEPDEVSRLTIFSELVGDTRAAIFEHFESLLKALREGENASFYDDFYRYYEDMNQIYFSFFEMAQKDDRYSGISNFGDFRLGVTSNLPSGDISHLMYFGPLNQEGFDLRIRIMRPDALQSFITSNQYEALPMPGAENYSLLRTLGSNMISSFIYVDDDISFFVLPGMLDPMMHSGSRDGEITIMSDVFDPTRDIYEYAAFVRSLQIDEFVKNWKSSWLDDTDDDDDNDD